MTFFDDLFLEQLRFDIVSVPGVSGFLIDYVFRNESPGIPGMVLFCLDGEGRIIQWFDLAFGLSLSDFKFKAGMLRRWLSRLFSISARKIVIDSDLKSFW